MDFNFDDYIPILDEESNHILALILIGQDIEKFALYLASRLGETTHYTIDNCTYFCKPNGGVYNMHVVYENGSATTSGKPSDFDVINRKVTLIVYAVYDRHGEYLESCENLKDAQDVAACYSDSTIVEMTGVIERDAPAPCNNKVTIKGYAAVDRDGRWHFWGRDKRNVEDTVSKSITPLVLVEFDKTIEWPHNA